MVKTESNSCGCDTVVITTCPTCGGLRYAMEADRRRLEAAVELLERNGVHRPDLFQRIAMSDLTHATLRIAALFFKWPHDAGMTFAGFDSAEKVLDACADVWKADIRQGETWRDERDEADEAHAETKRGQEAAVKALQELERWSNAYPLTVFPEPDFVKARQLLEAGGMTLDSISASNMRHVVERVGEIARAALAAQGGTT